MLNESTPLIVPCLQDLATVLQSGWLNDFSTELKYITLQHYPQDICSGTYPYGISYYLQHSNAVSLAQWQGHGIQIINAAPAASRKPILMDEFNTASCGGIPNISDTFASSLWSADYALQLASVGYSGAYLHTREPGVTYNIFNPPVTPSDSWSVGPGYYSMLAVAEALQPATNGSVVVDLNIEGSMSNAKIDVAGYAIYDVSTSHVSSLVLFNFANDSGAPTSFTIDPAFFNPASGHTSIRYMTAPSVNEKTNISWGAQTYANTGDGNPVPSSTQWTDQSVSCGSGCTVQIPGPGLALLTVGVLEDNSSSNPNSTASGSGSNPSPTDPSNKSSSSASLLAIPSQWLWTAFLVAFLTVVRL